MENTETVAQATPEVNEKVIESVEQPRAQITKEEAEQLRVDFFKVMNIDVHKFDKSLKDMETAFKEKPPENVKDEHWYLTAYLDTNELAYLAILKQRQLVEGAQIMRQLQEDLAAAKVVFDKLKAAAQEEEAKQAEIERTKPKIITLS